MNANKLALAVVPGALMIGAMIALRGHEQWFAGLGKTPQAALLLGRIGIALPYLGAAAIGIVILFACAGALAVRSAGWGVLAGASAVVGVAAWWEEVACSASPAASATDRCWPMWTRPH